MAQVNNNPPFIRLHSALFIQAKEVRIVGIYKNQVSIWDERLNKGVPVLEYTVRIGFKNSEKLTDYETYKTHEEAVREVDRLFDLLNNNQSPVPPPPPEYKQN